MTENHWPSHCLCFFLPSLLPCEHLGSSSSSQLEKAHTTSPRTHYSAIQDGLRPPPPQFPWSYSVSLQFSALGICLFSLSEATAQNNHQKTITTVCLCQSCPTSQGVSALAQVELIWWPLFKANGVYIFYWKNFVVGNIFPHFYFLFQLLEKLAFFVFTSSRCSYGTIQNNHWEFQEGFGDRTV